jgi:hypothetical protein
MTGTGVDTEVSEPSPPRASAGQWVLFLAGCFWLAIVPLGVMAGLSALLHLPPNLLVQLGLASPNTPLVPEVAVGLLATALTLALYLLLFIPLYLATRKPQHEFLNTATRLLIGVALVQILNSLASLPWPPDVQTMPLVQNSVLTAALRLGLVLPFLLLGLGWLEARRTSTSLIGAWQRIGLRLKLNPSAVWLAVGAAAVIAWPWVLVGSLGSPGTTAANTFQALPGALSEEILFRGFALAWLWRAAHSRRAGALASLLLFVAAQGATVLPAGDWTAVPRFLAAMALGLLTVELTVRAGGSIWPAVLIHLVYNWFPITFVDPRSQEEVLHWLAQAWAPLAAGGIGLLLWGGRKILNALRGTPISPSTQGGTLLAAVPAVLLWTVISVVYLTQGAPGFHPDGFLIFFQPQADLSQASTIADPLARRDWVYKTLVATAESSQAPLRAELDRLSIPYRSHYLINAIEVQSHPGLRRSIARQPGVASVLFQPGVRPYPYSFQLPNVDTTGPSGVEWNIHQVGGDRVWELGYTGQGVVVGNADTGVAWDHPALKAAYLGWDATGGGSVSHDFHWYDPWDGSAQPSDDSGHGTHTTGIMVGQDGENRIGMAPGARWIACRNMRHGIGNPGAYLSCMEFLLAPFPIGGDPIRDGDPAQGAQVVNNSWGCPPEEGCQANTLRLAVDGLRAAGQMMVVSAGNDGPACGTVQDPPAVYSATLGVGATDEAEQIASFSSRGPVTVDGSDRAKPDSVAPGVNIRSAVPNGYASLSGTSMAGPHVAGVVALLWSADPSLIGDTQRTEEILLQTAHPLTVDAICTAGSGSARTVCACGNEPVDSMPNDVYGWGEIDAWAAVQKILQPN